MYYVMSDIHGEYEKYRKMLDLIHFSDEDILFVLGDIVDRGKHPVAVLRDMMQRTNIFPVSGNHDFLACYLLQKLNVDITEETCDNTLTEEDIQDILAWIEEGGDTTVADFQKLTVPERQDILDYLAEFPLYETIDVGEKTFIMVHAGLGNFRKEKKLHEYSAEELLMTRDDPDKSLFDDQHIYLITGHTPTPLIHGKAEIYQHENHICIDCGACYPDGRLACLCLDTMQAFYI